MEYVTVQLTPSPTRGWVAHVYVKATMPAVMGHPRTLRTFPDILVTGLSGLETGAVAAAVVETLRTLGAMPFCARCAAALGFAEDPR